MKSGVPANCGGWALGREIGRGAYGIVFLATGPRGEKAAVKVCTRDSVGDERYERELRGAKLYRTIPSSKGLVRLLDFGECDWGFYLAMELADDEFGVEAGETSAYRPKTLSRVIAGEKALPVGTALNLGITLAKGLVVLQRHHLLHRDIKPGNVVYVRGRPVLSDLGLLVEESDAASFVGTPGFVPPENFTGSGGDVYSLGLTLKAASFGRAVEELERGPTLEADTGSPLFPAWWRILNKATHHDAMRRYQSATALLKDLRSLRRQMILLPLTRNVSRIIQIVIGVLVIVLCVNFIVQKQEQEKYVAEQTKAAETTANELIRDLKATTDRINRELREQGLAK